MSARKSTELENEPTPKTPAEEANAAEAQPESPVEVLERKVQAPEEEKLRLIAESRNQQQRAARERAEALRYAESDFARELLVILDDLERTQQSAQDATDVQAVADGVRIVYEHFLKVLKGRGIEPIDAQGKPFDPEVHEAMMQQPSAEHAPGTVMQELARGYRMHERVLRPTRVVVSSAPVAPEAEPE